MLLKNCKIFQNNNFVYRDILIKNKKIVNIDENINNIDCKIIDVNGKFVSAGFIDVHVHFREPGFENKETIKTGTLAASRGGYTTVMTMPNLNPVPDTYENLKKQLDIIKKDAIIRVIPYASITKGEDGKEYVDFESLSKYVFGFSDDGRGVQSSEVMYKAMQCAKKVNKPIVAHCEDNSLIFGGSIHKGKKSKELAVKGIPSCCESVQVARDILLAKETRCHYHICHISTKESVDLVRMAKKWGINVTCEVTPHHLISTEDDVTNIGYWKMNPPLRTLEDKKALIDGIIDGTIDIIATDHAPHTELEKNIELEKSSFGIVGLETAFSLLYTKLVKENIISLEKLVNLMTKNVSNIFNLSYGKLEIGCNADLCVIDLEKKYKINSNEFFSKGKNTPYNDLEVYGKIELTIYDGEIVYENKEV